MPYKFKVRAVNVYGKGPFSLESTFTPVNEPAVMDQVTTTLQYPSILIKFSEPDNSGLPVLDYEVQLLDHALNDYREVKSLCDGTLQTVIDNLECSVTVADLISVLSYERGQELIVKVRARNSEGYGQLSSPNSSGARVETPPVFMNDPFVTSYTKNTIDL